MALLLSVGVVTGAGYLSLAGPLDPPSGPVQPTSRGQLSQALTPPPHVITESGSYVLTSNLLGVEGEHGIIVAANDVTIDLNGFSIIGVVDSVDGIHLSPTTRRCTIRDGVIRDWGNDGIGGLNEAEPIQYTRVERLHAENNRFGMLLGDYAHVTGCVASNNSGGGIFVAWESLVSECRANNNEGIGITASSRSLVDRSVSTANGSHGIAIYSGLVRGCMSASNSGAQIHDATSGEALLIENHTLP